MGLLDRFFSSDSNEEKKKIRAQFKNKKYFKKEINYFNKIINLLIEDNKKYKQENGENTGYQFVNLSLKYIRLLECYYSQGGDVQQILPYFEKAIENLSQGWSEEYQGYNLLLEMVSLGVLLDIPKNEFQKIKDFIHKADVSSIEDLWKPDSLIFYLLGETDKKRESPFPAYKKLYQITQQPKEEAEISIKKYLDNWYSMHKDEPWYNSHLRDSGYSGYWAWEVAAVVKVKGLDDTGFKDNPYYPYDMVHWED
ncbi:DUF1911 domain-containing protein [Apibacter muscae]|uniref:PoNe immunity protein domain-containing protein n=1 Tax=Apibacter muscae TaxID=2509004 RepID=UPI0011AD1352|nr:PoNe immunity protein domain-containing protein [Apibacter muscae]TWP23051.1 DUF1911 domain-containing protein [Apibacter muscae]